MIVGKVQAALYSIHKHLQGHQVLKNPKGTSGTVVKTLEHLEFISSSTLDISGEYVTKTKDFSKLGKSSTLTQYLFYDRYAYFNDATQRLDRKKHLDYLQTANPVDNNLFKAGEKGAVPYEDLKARNLEPLKRIVARVEEEYLDFTFAFLGAFFVNERTSKKTYADLVVDKYHKAKQKDRALEYQKPSFWKVLFHNLSQ